MSETFARYEGPMTSDYLREQELLFNDQITFFKRAFAEGIELEDKTRKLRGPRYADFERVKSATEHDIRQINKNFTIEHIMPAEYRSKKASSEVKEAQADYLLEIAKNERLRRLDHLSRRYIDMFSHQQIGPQELNETPYCRQEDNNDDGHGSRACAAACFRMVFGAITRTIPFRAPVVDELMKRYGTPVVEDIVFSNVYKTEVFKEKYERTVETLDIIGADLGLIQTFAKKMKARHEDAEIYAVVSLGSQAGDRSIWHTAVLLEANGSEVILHDPSNTKGGAFKKHSYEEFYTRWAIAYNRVQIFIA